MRQDFKIGVRRLCALFGKTRHAFYDKEWKLEEETVECAIVLKLVEEQRKVLPRVGTPKLHGLIQPSLAQHKIKMGIKKLHELLSFYGMTVRRKRRKTITTFSKHWLKKYPNLIREVEVTYPEEVWVADITYIALKNGFCYLSLLTDAYSRKIVGYCLHETLDRHGPLQALAGACKNRLYLDHTVIHHSDRGIQYCCSDYIKYLKQESFMISMTENGDPYENAIAERVNGILKDEFNLDRVFDTYTHAADEVSRVIPIYNCHRPHASCDFLTPDQAHQRRGKLKRRWKTYYKIRQHEEEIVS